VTLNTSDRGQFVSTDADEIERALRAGGQVILSDGTAAQMGGRVQEGPGGELLVNGQTINALLNPDSVTEGAPGAPGAPGMPGGAPGAPGATGMPGGAPGATGMPGGAPGAPGVPGAPGAPGMPGGAPGAPGMPGGAPGVTGATGMTGTTGTTGTTGATGTPAGFDMRGPDGEIVRIMPGDTYNRQFDELVRQGWTAVDPIGGHDMVLTEVPGGGYLLDGIPANVISGQGWLQGQKEKMQTMAQAPPPGQDWSIVPETYSTYWAQPFQSANKEFSFDPQQIFNDPSFQFIQGEGEKGIMRAASAGGRVGGGRTMKDMSRWNTGLASTFINDYFNRQMAENQLGYGRDIGEHGLAYDVFRNNQMDRYNKLMGVTNLGLGAAGNLAAAGADYGRLGGPSILTQGDIRATGRVGAYDAQNAFNPSANLSNLYLANRFGVGPYAPSANRAAS
jgi:hypothetical protein